MNFTTAHTELNIVTARKTQLKSRRQGAVNNEAFSLKPPRPLVKTAEV